ncbi:MAG: trypsin-like serine protease [Bdellovibrio sp.]|nr:trypsin-like serine protease [Bdellovibrio sp.]
MKVGSLKKLVGPVVAALLLAGCGQQSSTELQVNAAKVVGGTPVSSEDFKHVVGLVRNGRIFCSGSLIESKKILTAGHCVTNFEIDTREAFEKLFDDVMEEVRAGLAGQDISVFNNASLPQKRELFKAALRRVIRNDAKAIKVYVGSSAAGGLETGLDVVADVDLSEGGLAYMEASVLKFTNLALPEDFTVEYSASFDYAHMTLKTTLPAVTPVPVISADEHADNVLLGQDVRVVGFGLKVDGRFVTSARSIVKELEDKIAAELDVDKKKQLQTELAKEKALYRAFLTLYFMSGNKNMVDLKLENYHHMEITLTKKGSPLAGACSGDSGGPALVKLHNGEWRQLGVVVTVDYCGNKTNVSPQFR